MVTSQFENAYMVHTLAELHHTASKSGRGSVYMSFCYNPVSSECWRCMRDSVLHLTQSNDKNHTPGKLDVDVLCHTVSPLQSCSQGPDPPMSREAPSCQMGSACRETHHARLAGRARKSRTGNEDTAPCWNHPSLSHTCSWNCSLSLSKVHPPIYGIYSTCSCVKQDALKNQYWRPICHLLLLHGKSRAHKNGRLE